MASLVDNLVTSGLVARTSGPDVAFDSWADSVQHELLRFQFDCDRPQAFRGTVRKRSLSDISFIGMESQRHAAYRDHEAIVSSERGYYLMTLQLSGQFRMEQDGRSALLKPGWFALYDSSKPATMTASDDYKSICLMFPKSCVGMDSEHALDDVTVVAFDCETGLSSAVWAMVLSLDQCLDSLGGQGALARRNMLEMITAMLRTDLGQPSLALTDPRELLLTRVREYIDARLHEPTLRPAEIAAAHYVSTRYLQKLFAHTGWTVMDWIRARRLEQCRRDLTNPHLAEVPVSSIGLRWGFTSPSHFGQVFKQASGNTPAEFRHAARVRSATRA